jgi:hypothetical protein
MQTLLRSVLFSTLLLWLVLASAAEPKWNTSTPGYELLKDAAWAFRVKDGQCQALPPGRSWDDPPRPQAGTRGRPITGPIGTAPRADGLCYAEDALKGTVL